MNKIDVNHPEVRMELMKLASSNSFLSLIGLFINVLIIVIVFWNIANQAILLSGITLFTILLILRTITAKSFLENPLDLPLETVEFRYKSVTLLTSIILSIGLIIILPKGLPFYQAFLSMIVAGLSAGAVMSLSFYKNIIRDYLLILILPFSYFMFIQDTQVHTFISILMILFLFMLIIFSRRYNKNIVDVIISTLVLERTKKEKKESEEKIHYQAFHDNLTGLANRLTFNEHLEQQLARLARLDHFGAILFMDLDNFKTINDSLGHHVGDSVLKIFASRASKITRKEDTIARLGGDEFVILLSDLGDNEEQAIQRSHDIAKKIHNIIKEPIEAEDNSLHLSISIGITIISSKDENINDILKHADIAMYQAKDAGRNMTYFYQAQMGLKIKEKLTLSNEMREAIKLNQFELYYQPIVNMKNDNITSCEALIRWNHPSRGLVFPDNFIPYAEESNLIIDIGEWVIEAACKQYKKCNGKLDDISVNISSKQFIQNDFIEKVLRITEMNDVHPSGLKLELTESVAIDNLDITVKKMNLLKSLGFKIAMDDFGTGYSSLSYLKNLPFNFIKIDRSFVKDMLEDEDDASLIKTILTISKQFNFAVIAEGVETQEHIEVLKDMGCEYYQGYVKSKAVPADEFRKLFIK